MKKRFTDEGLKERVQKAIEKRIEELKARQYDRAEAIEKSLTAYEKNIRIRSVNDYVSLSKMQRLLCGLDTENTKVEHTGGIHIGLSISDEERKNLKEIAHEIASRKKRGI